MGRPQDALPFSWNEKGTELSFILKADLSWSDGVPLTACQYRDGLLRVLAPQTPSALAELLFDVEGAADFKAGRISSLSVGVDCSDENHQLRVRVNKPFSTKTLYAFALPITAPLRKERLESLGANWLLGGKALKPIGTGPLLISEWSHRRRIVLKPRIAGSSPRLVFSILADASGAYRLYESGQLDLLEEIPSLQLRSAEARSDFKSFPIPATYYIAFSNESGSRFQSLQLRQAIAESLNVAELSGLLKGGERMARGLIPPELYPSPDTAAEPSQLWAYNPASARARIEKWKREKQKEIRPIELMYNSGERHKILMERVAYQIETNLGLKVQLQPMEWAVYVSSLKIKAPEIFRYPWTAAYPDPRFFLELFGEHSLNNFGKYRNPKYNSLIEQLGGLSSTRDGARFWDRVRQAEKLLIHDDVALIPLYHYRKSLLIKPSLKGLELNSLGFVDFSKLRKAP